MRDLTFWNTADPRGLKVTPGGGVILSDDGPVWKYCNLMLRAINEGACMVAIAHGIDTATDGESSVVCYSNSEDYFVGQTIRQCDAFTRERDKRGSD